MLTAYVVVTVLTIVANVGAAAVDFVRPRFLLANGAEAGIPPSWLPTLGILKAAGAAGLLLGLFGATLIGTAAAIGLALYFVGAVAALLRARAYNQLGFPVPYLLLAIAALVLGLLTDS